MSRSASLLVAVAGLYGAFGVATAAIAAHRLADPTLVTASNFLILHAAALLGAAGAAGGLGLGRYVLIPAWAIALGTLLFCGALLFRVAFDVSLPMVAPTGGVLLILGWIALTIGAALGASRPSG